jgi:hypothetical protein
LQRNSYPDRGFLRFLSAFHITSNTPFKTLPYHWCYIMSFADEKTRNESTLFLYIKPLTPMTHSRRRNHNSSTRCNYRWSHNFIVLICAIQQVTKTVTRYKNTSQFIYLLILGLFANVLGCSDYTASNDRTFREQ